MCLSCNYSQIILSWQFLTFQRIPPDSVWSIFVCDVTNHYQNGLKAWKKKKEREKRAEGYLPLLTRVIYVAFNSLEGYCKILQGCLGCWFYGQPVLLAVCVTFLLQIMGSQRVRYGWATELNWISVLFPLFLAWLFISRAGCFFFF